MRFSALTVASIALLSTTIAACNTKDPTVSAEPKPTSTAAPAPSAAPAAPEGALRLGAAIEKSAESVTLSDVAKNPNSFVGKKFATTGTVTAVCQHMGCWMELKDEAGEAHIKMAGHAFFVPKTASGRKAKVLATLVQSPEDGACADANHDKVAAAGGPAAAPAKGAAPSAAGAAPKKGCKAEAEAQLGRPLAKLELLAEGVELM